MEEKDILDKLDDFIIDVIAQKLSNKYQLRTKKTNFYLANIFLVVYLAIHTPMLALLFTIDNLSVLYITWHIAITLIVYAIVLFTIVCCLCLNKEYKNRGKPDTVNPLRVIFPFVRVMFLLLNILCFLFICFAFPQFFSHITETPLIISVAYLLIIFHSLLNYGSTVCGLYFSACKPMESNELN